VYAIYCGDPALLRRLAAALPADQYVLTADRWSELERLVPRAACVVLCFRWLREWQALARTAPAGASPAARPLVLATSKDADNARLLKGFRVDEVVWLDDVERELWPAVRGAESRGVLRRLGDALDGAASLPPLLRAALAHACRSAEPVRSVSELALAVGRDRRTLWRLWRGVHGGAPPLRLEDFLHWLLVLRGTASRRPRGSWTAVAREMRVHEHTLARAAAALAGRSLRELAAEGEAQVALRFEREVVGPLVAGLPIPARAGRSATSRDDLLLAPPSRPTA
jgi:hypothetical protein